MICNGNFVVFFESLQNDSIAVQFFNGKLIDHLKEKFGAENVRKIFYFSDGTGSQYKDKYNLSNLVYHKKDFGIDAEWHFSATSHGKGAYDVIGGTFQTTCLFCEFTEGK